MKKLTVLLFSILISFNSYGLFGLFEKTICSLTDAQNRNGLVYLPNQQEPFTGNNSCVYANTSQQYLTSKFKDGKEDGKKTVWHENGQKMIETILKDGKLDGKVTSWYDNGQKEVEENWKDDKLNGKSTAWHVNGQIAAEGNYKDDKLIKCISGVCD
jgi:antitoxin component YwqK of YwqJK toxin-antitoxin module